MKIGNAGVLILFGVILLYIAATSRTMCLTQFGNCLSSGASGTSFPSFGTSSGPKVSITPLPPTTQTALPGPPIGAGGVYA